ncbi:MAG: cytochrome c oxidase subunit II [Rhodospirillaceae bacterium]
MNACFAVAFGFLLALSAPAQAADKGMGIAKPWQINFQDAVSPVMERIESFHELLFWIITVITLFVLALLIYVIVKFNEKANPVPSKTTHNTLIEVIWTVVPIVILVVVAVPSFKLLFFYNKHENPDMTLKVIGQQWYWSYEYPDHGKFAFDSQMIEKDKLKPGQPRLLAVDNEVVLPVDTNIRLIYASEDVIHNWAMPSMGLKQDTVPGRINENWVRITREGDYYGQCSELCGVRHAFMPIHIRAVSKQDFADWVKTAQKKFAKADGSPADPVQVAVDASTGKLITVTHPGPDKVAQAANR